MTATGKSRSKGKIIVFGILFWYPLAGVTFQFLHYLLGLRRLGYDPYYVEDSGRWIYDPRLNDLSPDARANIEAVLPALKAVMEEFGELTDLPGVIPAPYMARAQWVALQTANALPPAELKRLLRQSYDLVFAKLPRKVRSQLT